MPLTDSLVSYFSLDEAASSDNAADAHGSNALLNYANPGTGSGKVGGCRTFSSSGAGKAFIASSAAVLSPGDTDFTLQAWVNLSSKAAPKAVAGKWGAIVDGLASDDYEYLLSYDNASDRFAFAVTSTGGAASLVGVLANNFGSPATGTWYLVHAWHDSVNNLIGISVNAGTADTTSHSAGVFSASVASFILGASDQLLANFVDGSLDESAFWARVLASGDRTDLYNGGNGLAYSDLTGSGGGTGSGAMVGGVAVVGAGSYGVFDSGSGVELIGETNVVGLGFYSPSVAGAGAISGDCVVHGVGTYADPIGGQGAGTIIARPIVAGVGTYTPPAEPITPPPPSGLIACVISFAGSAASIPVYDLDDVVRVIATYTDLVTTLPVDPASVVFKLRAPGTDLVSVTTIRDSVGVYHVDLAADKVGNWRFRWQAAGTGEDGQFTVVSTLAD